MFFEIERLSKIVQELHKLRYLKRHTFDHVWMKDGFYKDIDDVEEAIEPWIAFDKDDRWGGKEKYAWFRNEVTVREDYVGKKLVYKVMTSRKDEWDSRNPQFLVFVNGKIIQGLDVNHQETILTEGAELGEKFLVDLQGYGGSIGNIADCIHEISILDDRIERLFYDLHVPLEVVKMLDKEDKDRIDTLKYLMRTINLIDFRKPYSDCFYASIDAATKYLEEAFYGNFCDPDGKVITWCVGHTHIDVAWRWDLAQTRLKVQRSYASVFELMKQYDAYIFMCSQPQLYQFLKEERPELYKLLKEKVKEGRWEPEGGMWVEADCNLTSGESLVRQVLYGKQFFRQEFGVENKILWLPDVFGYSAALPQILKKSSIDYFMTTKISWNEYNKLPYDTFEWEGIDGSKVLSHFITTANFDNLPERYFTTYNGYIDPKSVKGAWERYQQKDISDEVLISYGYGDGGGGPSKDMFEIARRLEKGIKGCPIVKMGTATEFFERLDANVSQNKKLPRWVGELYFEYHRGTLTSMARNKRYNRKSEFLYEDIEWLSMMAHLVDDRPYPKEAIDFGWEIICLNQFHDIIPGSSIKKVYEDSKEQYEDILNKGETLKKQAIEAIVSKVQVENEAVIVFNSLSFERKELITFEYPKKMCIYDQDMKLDTTYEKGYISFCGTLPAKGYKTFLMKDEEVLEEIEGLLKASKEQLENQFFDIHLDEQGHIISLWDKRVGRQVIKEHERANVLLAFEDKPHNYDAWDINIYYQEKMWEIDDVTRMEVIENKGLKATLLIERSFLDSTIVQHISIYRDLPKIDFKTMIDWKESHILVKAAFPVDIHTSKATYDIQYGNIERSTHWNTSWDTAKFEVCGHKWADLSEDGYGVSLLNDCKYGHDIKDSVMRLTLLKSPTAPNEDADREMHYFTYALYPHIGDFRKGHTVQEAYKLNVAPYTVITGKHEGILPDVLSFVTINKENVIAEVVKQCEYSHELVIRVYECYHKRTRATLHCFRSIKEVVECDLEERKVYDEHVSYEDNHFTFEIKPYEIKTFKVKL